MIIDNNVTYRSVEGTMLETTRTRLGRRSDLCEVVNTVVDLVMIGMLVAIRQKLSIGSPFD